MKKKFIIGGAIALIIIGTGMFFGFGQSGAGEASNAEFMSAYKDAENAILVDVRTADEFNSGHIDGAVNVDFYDQSFIDKMKALGADKNFFIYCRSGNRSGQALSQLAGVGIAAQHLNGGIATHPELLR